MIYHKNMNFIPTKEQILIAERSHTRYFASLKTLFYSPYEWAVLCLQNEYVLGIRLEW